MSDFDLGGFEEVSTAAAEALRRDLTELGPVAAAQKWRDADLVQEAAGIAAGWRFVTVLHALNDQEDAERLERFVAEASVLLAGAACPRRVGGNDYTTYECAPPGAEALASSLIALAERCGLEATASSRRN